MSDVNFVESSPKPHSGLENISIGLSFGRQHANRCLRNSNTAMSGIEYLQTSFCSLIDEAQESLLPNFVSWLDLKVAEYKVLGHMVLKDQNKMSQQQLNASKVTKQLESIIKNVGDHEHRGEEIAFHESRKLSSGKNSHLYDLHLHQVVKTGRRKATNPKFISSILRTSALGKSLNQSISLNEAGSESQTNSLVDSTKKFASLETERECHSTGQIDQSTNTVGLESKSESLSVTIKTEPLDPDIEATPTTPDPTKMLCEDTTMADTSSLAANQDRPVDTSPTVVMRVPQYVPQMQPSLESNLNIRMVHTGEYPYKCDMEKCRKGFHSQSMLGMHQQAVHGKTWNDQKCGVCDLVVSTPQLLSQHMRSHECGEYRCCQCLKTFSCKYYLDRHMKTHEERIQCDHCEKSYTTRQHLKDHMRIHNEEFSRCSKCNFKTTYSQSLRRHVARVHRISLNGSDFGDDV